MPGPTDIHQGPGPADIQQGMKRASLELIRLWLGYYSLGGNLAPEQLRAYLSGTGVLSGAQYDMLAQALNDVFLEGGFDHPVAYTRE